MSWISKQNYCNIVLMKGKFSERKIFSGQGVMRGDKSLSIYSTFTGTDSRQSLDGTIVSSDLTIPPTFKRESLCHSCCRCFFSETLIFRNYLGSQHLQLISTSYLEEILYSAHPCNSTFSIQLSNHFNLIISSWEALYGVMGSRATQLTTV